MKLYICTFVIIFLSGFLDHVISSPPPLTEPDVNGARCYDDHECQMICNGSCDRRSVKGTCTYNWCWCQPLNMDSQKPGSSGPVY